MTLEKLCAICRALPHVTEGIQWDDDLLFRVGNKIFTVACLDPAARVRLAFKCDPETFGELVERDGIIPAPYMARNHWVALERFDALPDREIADRVREAYRLVFAKLPKKLQAQLAVPGSGSRSAPL
jgi:predicted DNA-binding protein (MmcQ/YjbR family)